jgi:uncharacterized lipoprotein YajG
MFFKNKKFMKKLIVLLVSSVLLFSCTKENETIQSKKNNVLLNDSLISSKNKQTVNGVTLVADFNQKTGQVSIFEKDNKQSLMMVRYQSYKGNNLTPNSSINFGSYVSPFVVLGYPSIPKGMKYMVNIQVKTTSGDYQFIFQGNKK